MVKENFKNICKNNKITICVNLILIYIILSAGLFLFSISEAVRQNIIYAGSYSTLSFNVMDADDKFIKDYGFDMSYIETASKHKYFTATHKENSFESLTKKGNQYVSYIGTDFNFSQSSDFLKTIPIPISDIGNGDIFITDMLASILDADKGDYITLSYPSLGFNIKLQVAGVIDYNYLNTSNNTPIVYVMSKELFQKALYTIHSSFEISIYEDDMLSTYRLYKKLKKTDYYITDPNNIAKIGSLMEYCIAILYGAVIVCTALMIIFQLKLINGVYYKEIKKLIIIKFTGGRIKDWLIAWFLIIEFCYILMFAGAAGAVKLIKNSIENRFVLTSVRINLDINIWAILIFFLIMQSVTICLFIIYSAKINRKSTIELMKEYS